MKVIVSIFLILIFFSANVIANGLDQEPLYESGLRVDSHEDFFIAKIKSELAAKYSHAVEDIRVSEHNSEWIQSKGKSFRRYTFALDLRDQKGPHGFNNRVVVVWIDDHDTMIKVFDKGIFSPL